VTVDLPLDEDGNDRGTSSLELSVMSLAGCIVTIFALVAARRRLTYDALSLDLDAGRPKGAPTIAGVRGVLRIRTNADSDEVATALAITQRTCPVGVIFERAHIPVELQVAVERPAPVGPAR
jgi:putative redox protein